MASSVVLSPLNEQKLQFLGLKDDLANFINNAAVTASLVDSSDNLINNVGTSTPSLSGVTLASIDQTGDYSFTILAAGFNPPIGQCILKIIAQVSATLKETIYVPATISKRTS